MAEPEGGKKVDPMLKDLVETSRKIDAEKTEKLTEQTTAKDGAGAEQSAETSPGEGGPGKDSEASANDGDPVEVQEGVERIIYRIAVAQGELRKQGDENREQLFVELSEEIHRAARWEVRDTVMEVLSGPAEAIAGTGHACAILASVARGEGDIGRGLGEASGVLGIVQRYLDRDSVTVRGEAMKLDKVLGTEGRVAARIGAAKQLIGAAQERRLLAGILG